ncbi:hypothetical protein JF66_15445 [Cryobacterium sp. MLB-32]|nr:hypothetical protein JF66_15445 [Cryobacterium sp. MLB-32]
MSDLYRLAAAVILMRVSKKYRGFDGLCGATEWKSVGLHFLATKVPVKNDEAIELLTYAVDDDPQNRLAALSLNWQLHRYATDPDEIQRHATWLLGQLDEIKDEVEGYEALRHRLVLNYLTSVCTLRSIPGHADAEQQAGMQALNLVAALHHDESNLAKDMRHLAAVSVRRLIPHLTGAPPTDLLSSGQTGHIEWGTEDWMGDDWLERANKNADPHVKYALACYYAQSESGSVEKSVRLLEDALVLPDLKTWAVKDPSLLPLHSSAKFAEFVGMEPAATWRDVPPFLPFKTKLSRLGIATPAQLVAAQTAPIVGAGSPGAALADYLAVGALELTVLLRAATFCEAVGEQGLNFGSFEHELISALLDQGITEIHQVVLMPPAERRKLVAQVSAAIGTRCVAGPDATTVSGWLGGFYIDVDIL